MGPRTEHALWVDAMCIDQNDMPERSSQVASMRRIYESSTSVYIWLGKGSKHTDLAFHTMQKFGTSLEGMTCQDVTSSTTITPENPNFYIPDSAECRRQPLAETDRRASVRE